MPDRKWIDDVGDRMREFADRFGTVLAEVSRADSSLFEIGVLHAVVEFYENKLGANPTPKNLTGEGEYRYLTTPSGDPANFSYIFFECAQPFELRQQVRVLSHLHGDVSVTPDLVVLKADSDLRRSRKPDYAGGKRSFFCVPSTDVIAAHECKSMAAFPELIAGFIGMAGIIHPWFAAGATGPALGTKHLAPTLFVGGAANIITHKMALALRLCYPVNIVTNLHRSAGEFLGPKAAPRLLT